MNFSLILNSRKRTSLLINLLENISIVTANISSIEVLINLDNDDKESLNLISHLINHYSFIKIEVEPRSFNVHQSLNKLCSHSTGKYIWVLNDDVEILTPQWDIDTYQILEQYLTDNNTEIIYGLTHDNSVDKVSHKQYASFPIISKKATEKLGFFMYERFVGLGGDVSIYRTYEAANKIVNLPNLQLNHLSHSSIARVFQPDETAAEMRDNTAKGPQDYWDFDISEDVKKLI